MQRRSNAPQVSDDNNVALKQCSLESIFLLQYAIYPIKKQIFWMNIKRLRNGRKYAGKNTTHITSNWTLNEQLIENLLGVNSVLLD